jgi:ureidoglycolate hydrolase
MPLIAFDAGQDFLIVDRGGKQANCDTHSLDRIVMLEAV